MIYFALALTSTHNLSLEISLIHLVNFYLIGFSFGPNFPWSPKWISFFLVMFKPERNKPPGEYLRKQGKTMSDWSITEIKWRTSSLKFNCGFQKMWLCCRLSLAQYGKSLDGRVQPISLPTPTQSDWSVGVTRVSNSLYWWQHQWCGCT